MPGKILGEQLGERLFTERPSNSRLVLGYMSKQKKVHKWLTMQQVELAKTCYLMMLRKAVAIHQAHEKKSDDNGNQKQKKKRESPRLLKKRKLIHDSSEDDEHADDTTVGIDDDAYPRAAACIRRRLPG